MSSETYQQPSKITTPMAMKSALTHTASSLDGTVMEDLSAASQVAITMSRELQRC